MVMGAAQGLEGIPKELGKGQLVEWDHCNKLLDRLPLLKDESSMEPVPGYPQTLIKKFF